MQSCWYTSAFLLDDHLNLPSYGFFTCSSIARVSEVDTCFEELPDLKKNGDWSQMSEVPHLLHFYGWDDSQSLHRAITWKHKQFDKKGHNPAETTVPPHQGPSAHQPIFKTYQALESNALVSL